MTTTTNTYYAGTRGTPATPVMPATSAEAKRLASTAWRLARQVQDAYFHASGTAAEQGAASAARLFREEARLLKLAEELEAQGL